MIEADGFIGHVGPFWTRAGGRLTGVLADDRHRNRRGVVQGGFIATLADRAMGHAARAANKDRPQATISLSVDYIASADAGEFIFASSRVTRVTRHVVFVDCDIYANARMVACAKATFKVLQSA